MSSDIIVKGPCIVTALPTISGSSFLNPAGLTAAMDNLQNEKRNVESKLKRLKDRVTAFENKKLEEEDRLHSVTGASPASPSQEISCLEATERWLKEKADLAEATVDLAKIDIDISRNEGKSDRIMPAISKLEVIHAEMKVKHALTLVSLSEVRIRHALNERERERHEKTFDNANGVLKNANDNLRIALKELEASAADSNVHGSR
jgi:hypothetical protein